MMRSTQFLGLVLLGLLVPASAASRYWDGGTSDLTGNGNGVSAGGAGTWNSSLTNWDPGNGIAYAAWNNAANDTAVFAGTAGVVAMGGDDLTMGGITISTNGYSIAGNGRNLTINGTGTTINGKQATSISGFNIITLGGNQTWTAASSSSYAIDLTVSGGTVQNSGYTLALAKTSNGYVAVTSLITGTGGVSVNANSAIGSAIYSLGDTPANTYTGSTTLNGFVRINDGLRNAGTASVFGASTSTDPALIQLNSGGVMLAGTGSTDRGMTLAGTCAFWAKGSASLTLNGKLTGSGGLTVYGDISQNGALILSGDNDFAGNLATGSDGRLRLASANAAAKATLNTTLGARASIDLITHNLDYLIGGLTGSGNLNLGTGTVSIGNNEQSTTHSGILTGGSLVKVGTGTLTLSGANSYTGGTVVNGGILAVNGSALPDTTQLVINAGKIAATGIETVDTLFFGTEQQAAGTWGATGSGADHIDDTHFSGTAGVVKVQPWSADLAVLAFGNVSIGHSVPLNVVITNLGTALLGGTASTDGSPFTVASPAWSVAPSSTTTVQVNFSPGSAQSFSGILTLTGGGLTRTVQLNGSGVALSVPVPSQFRDYRHVCQSGMPAAAATPNLILAEGASVTQSFIPRRDAFLADYTARDAAAPSSCHLSRISVRTGSYTNSPSTLRFEVFRVENDNTRTPLASEAFQKTVGGNTTYTFTLTTPPILSYDAVHELKVTVVTAGNPTYGGPNDIDFFRSSANYPDGALNTSGDLWFDLSGLAPLPVYSELSAAAGTACRFFLDAEPLNANSASYDALPGKLLGAAGELEPVVFTRPAAWGPLAFEIDAPGIASGSVTGTTGTSDTLTLAGQAEGRRMLWIRAGTTVVGWMKLQAYPRRSMRLSYSYVQFPGENDNPLKNMNAQVTAYISGVYDKANVGILWTDNGLITHEWDLNGDGSSYADDYSEIWSPLDSGAIPNPLSVFSNVYMLRYDKDDATVRGSGGGTSRGYGETPPPANGATVRGTLNRNAGSIGSTLAHEIGHNLGLSHTDITNNLMDVGRQKDNLWSPQWDIVHQTLASLPAVVTNPDENTNGLPDAWEDFWFGNHNPGENPADGDSDHDGLVNLIEFATGTNPTASNPSPMVMSYATLSGARYLQLTVPRNAAAADYQFVAEFTTDFQTWTEGTEMTNGAEFTARDTVPIGTQPGRRFGRISVISP